MSADGDALGIPRNLETALGELDRPALAFSGGVDSAYLLYAASVCCDDVIAYSVSSAFQKEKDTAVAAELAEKMGVRHRVLHLDILADPRISANREDRCYLCKTAMFGKISAAALDEGRGVVMDATNASDDPAGRPGMRALTELGIESPLRECGLAKTDVRRLSKMAGLPTWDAPSDSCLATRIPVDTRITSDMLTRTEASEEAVGRLGLSGFRVKTRGRGAVLEIPEDEKGRFMDVRHEAESYLLRYYQSVHYEFRGRRE